MTKGKGTEMKWTITLIAAISVASAGEISDIREHYTAVKEMIESGEQLYRSDLEINSEGMMYPAVGIYGRSFDFYWDLNPEDYPSGRLLFISVESQYSAVEEYEEFLYSYSGELVFCFRSGGYEMTEERFYFHCGSLIRYIQDGESTDSPDDGTREEGERILLESERLYQAFNLVH